jgi:hypothetical protein
MVRDVPLASLAPRPPFSQFTQLTVEGVTQGVRPPAEGMFGLLTLGLPAGAAGATDVQIIRFIAGT